MDAQSQEQEPPMKDLDVYAYGVIASSTLHLLSQPFPRPDGYAEIGQTHFMTGGEALNSAIVLSRLGLRVQLDGNWIGDTPEGERLLATIQGYGIDARRLQVKKGFSGVREVVFFRSAKPHDLRQLHRPVVLDTQVEHSQESRPGTSADCVCRPAVWR
jgi:hypothetical protein